MRILRANRSAGQSGFTLVEIMVVVIVIAILVGAVAPKLGGTLFGVRLRAAANELADMFDYCQQAAVATGRVHALTFDEEGHAWEVTAEEAGESEMGEMTLPEIAPEMVPVSLPGHFVRELPESISIASISVFEEELMRDDAGLLRVLFFPDGTSEFASFYLATPVGDRRAVKLNGMSGTITIEDPGPAGLEADSTANEDEE